MVTIIAGICVVACFIVIIFAIRILKEGCKWKIKDDNDDEIIFRS
jgi:hypothetical protein